MNPLFDPLGLCGLVCPVRLVHRLTRVQHDLVGVPGADHAWPVGEVLYFSQVPVSQRASSVVAPPIQGIIVVAHSKDGKLTLINLSWEGEGAEWQHEEGEGCEAMDFQ